LEIADRGLRIAECFGKSEIRNPRSEIKSIWSTVKHSGFATRFSDGAIQYSKEILGGLFC